MRQVRGLSVLTSLLSSLLRPGIADIYQLRVSVCMAVKAVVAGGHDLTREEQRVR